MAKKKRKKNIQDLTRKDEFDHREIHWVHNTGKHSQYSQGQLHSKYLMVNESNNNRNLQITQNHHQSYTI